MNKEAHVERILSVLDAGQVGYSTGLSNVDGEWSPFSSWHRCANSYGLQPSLNPSIPFLTARETDDAAKVFGERNLAYVGTELERMLSIVGSAGYTACLADRHGLIIAEGPVLDDGFVCVGDKLGAVWSEEYGGTNAIGTALIEERVTSVYRGDHFCHDFIVNCCVAAPLRDSDGRIVGALSLSTNNPKVDEVAHSIAYNVALESAARLEERFFRLKFPNDWVLRFDSSTRNPRILLAVSEEGFITGATKAAKSTFSLGLQLDGTESLWDIFDRSGDPALRASTEPFGVALRVLATGRLARVRVWRSMPSNARTPKSAQAIQKAQIIAERATSVSIVQCAGQDRQMLKNIGILRKLKNSGLPVLLLGETGVGKDTLAKAIHAESDRASGPFVSFNCAAVPETLIDSELFGYERGAFTGANREGNAGRFVEADGGTIFLDEIGDMPLQLQTRLLRVLESGEIMPLGSGKRRQVDVQVVAATNQKLQEKVEMGQFREDLFYRLSGVIFNIPPLRDRDDVEAIAIGLLRRYAGGMSLSFEPEALRAITDYPWPGNIRELRMVLQRAVRLTDGDTVSVENLMLPRQMVSTRTTRSEPSLLLSTNRSHTDFTAKGAIVNAERAAICEALSQSDYKIDQASKSLDMSRATLYRKIKQYGIGLNS